MKKYLPAFFGMVLSTTCILIICFIAYRKQRDRVEFDERPWLIGDTAQKFWDQKHK